MGDLTRREALASMAAGAVLASIGAPAGSAEVRSMGSHKNADFYGPDGKFNDQVAKDAYYDMMRAKGYPISQNLRALLWAVDFSLGRFTEVGMGGVFWVNDQQYGYFGHDIFLLPGQMIPEHRHLKTPAGPAKMEAWHARFGSVWLFGEGDSADPAGDQRVPAAERPFVTCRFKRRLNVGEVVPLDKPEAWHFMMGGPEGGIVTEYATYHDGAGLRFTNPGIKF